MRLFSLHGGYVVFFVILNCEIDNTDIQYIQVDVFPPWHPIQKRAHMRLQLQVEEEEQQREWHKLSVWLGAVFSSCPQQA